LPEEKELPVDLTVVRKADIDKKDTSYFAEGEAVEIVTGAMLPPGTEAVIPVENTERSGDIVRIRGKFRKGDFIRPKGIEYSSGSCVLKKAL